jgi:hypothetical protein
MSRRLTGSSSIATTLRLFGFSVLLLASFQTTRVATAAGSESDIVDLLSTGRIRTSATWCYKKPGPERCATTLHMKNGSLVLEGVGCGSFQVPVNGSNGRQSARIEGNTITVSVTGKNGTGVNTYELSPDLAQCSHTVECPAGFQAKVFSCSVVRNPTQAVTQQGASAKTSPEIITSSEKSETPSPAPGGAPVAAQSYMAAARALKEQEPNYNSLSAAALILRRAAAAFQAAGDNARAQAAADEAQTLESFVKLANERGGDPENQNRCGVLRGNALACYDRATRLRSASPSTSTPEKGAFLDCVKTYCSAMQSASCPMPIFGKDNAGFCFTAATDDFDHPQQDSPACAPGKHLVSAPGAGEPICRDDATGSTKPQPGSRGTKPDR